MTILQISSTAPQLAFHNLEQKYCLFSAGFGTGKSETMINQAILDGSHSPDALIGLYAPTYDLVRLITAPRLLEKLTEYGIQYVYNKSENIVYCKGWANYILRTLDNPERIIGYETYRAHIDELDTLKEVKAEDAWNKIIARNRQSPKGVVAPFNRVSAYSTPEGFKFTYKRWVKDKNKEYAYIKASTLSNPFLPVDYVDSLRATYPAELIEAYINGEFVNLTSGTVYRSYNRHEHNSNETVTGNEALYIGMDFNIDKMAATIYVKRGREWHAVDEVHDSHNVYSTADTIRSRYPSNSIYIYPDASGNNRNRTGKAGQAAESDIAALRDKKYDFKIRVNSRNPAVKDRINAYNVALEQGNVFVNASICTETANCLEQQAYDKNGEPDKTAGNDHQNDATTYVIAYELPIRKPVAKINVSFAI